MSLILELLRPDPEHRPNAADALQHCWLTTNPSLPISEPSVLETPTSSVVPSQVPLDILFQRNYNSFLQSASSNSVSITVVGIEGRKTIETTCEVCLERPAWEFSYTLWPLGMAGDPFLCDICSICHGLWTRAKQPRLFELMTDIEDGISAMHLSEEPITSAPTVLAIHSPLPTTPPRGIQWSRFTPSPPPASGTVASRRWKRPHGRNDTTTSYEMDKSRPAIPVKQSASHTPPLPATPLGSLARERTLQKIRWSIEASQQTNNPTSSQTDHLSNRQELD